MTQRVPHPHSPEEMRRFSNVGHEVEGAIISAAGILMLLGARRFDETFSSLASSLISEGGRVRRRALE